MTHEPPPNAAPGTGRAVLPDGRALCYACADSWQLEQMRAGRMLAAYLSTDGKVVTWSGGELARVTSRVVRRVGFGRAERHYVTAVDAAGKRWHGAGPGPGMYLNLRASKERTP